MTSCGGTSQVTVRSDTRTILSMGQKMGITPGPLSFLSTRPKRKTTARSYSRKMFKHLKNQMTKMMMAVTTTGVKPEDSMVFSPP